MFYDEDDIIYYEEQQKEVQKFIGNQNTEYINENSINIGDKIVIEFYPYSQRHIYILYFKYGEVIENINNEDEETSLMNVRLKNNKTEYYALHDGVGLYSRGYDYRVIKLI